MPDQVDNLSDHILREWRDYSSEGMDFTFMISQIGRGESVGASVASRAGPHMHASPL